MVSLDTGADLTFAAALFPHISATLSSSTGFINVSPMLCGFFCWAIARLAINEASVLCLVVCQPSKKTLQSLRGMLTDKNSAYAEKKNTDHNVSGHFIVYRVRIYFEVFAKIQI